MYIDIHTDFTAKIRNIPEDPHHVDPKDDDPPNLHVAEQLGLQKPWLMIGSGLLPILGSESIRNLIHQPVFEGKGIHRVLNTAQVGISLCNRENNGILATKS